MCIRDRRISSLSAEQGGLRRASSRLPIDSNRDLNLWAWLLDWRSHCVSLAQRPTVRGLHLTVLEVKHANHENARGKRRGSAHVLSLIHISEPTRQAESSYAVFCLKK